MDSTGKLTKDGEWLYRFVGVFRDSGTQTDYVPDDRIVLAPSLTWRPTNNTSWTVLGTYQKDTTGSSTAFLPHEGTLFPGPNGLIPVRRFASEPSFDKYQTETGAVSQPVRAQFWRWAEDPAEHALRPCRGHLQDDVSGFDYRTRTDPFLDSSRRTVARCIWSRANDQGQLHLRQQRRTESSPPAPVTHKMLFGVDYRGLGERASSASTSIPTPFDLYAPVYTGIDRAGAVARTGSSAEPARALCAGPDAARAVAGCPRRPAGFCQQQCGGSAGGRHQGDHRPRRADVRTAVRPDALRVLRAVVQSDLRRRRLRRRSARPSAASRWNSASSTIRSPAPRSTARSSTPPRRTGWRADPDSSLFSIQTGKVRIRGAELEVISRVTPDLDLIGAYSYLDAIVESGDNAGKRVETVPEHQASLWAKYRLTALGLQGVTIGGGVRYIGDSWDGADKLQTPDYTLFDAMIRYETGPVALSGQCQQPCRQASCHHLPGARRLLLRHRPHRAGQRDVQVLARDQERWRRDLLRLRPIRLQKQPRRAVDHARDALRRWRRLRLKHERQKQRRLAHLQELRGG